MHPQHGSSSKAWWLWWSTSNDNNQQALLLKTTQPQILHKQPDAKRVTVMRLSAPPGCEQLVVQRDVSIAPSAKTTEIHNSCLWRPSTRRKRSSLKCVTVIRPLSPKVCESVVVQRDYTIAPSTKRLESCMTFSRRSPGRCRRLNSPVVVMRQPIPMDCESVVAQRDYFIVAPAELHGHGSPCAIFSPKCTRNQRPHLDAEVRDSKWFCIRIGSKHIPSFV